MDDSVILALASELDNDAVAIVARLNAGGHRAVLFNPRSIPLASSFTIRDSAEQGALVTLTEEIPFAQIRSVWWRSPQAPELPTGVGDEAARMLRKEAEQATDELWASLDCFWMSRPEYIRTATLKPLQLARAAALGFEVPKTLITSDPIEAAAFFDACDGKVIYKVLSDPFLGASRSVYENDLPLHEIRILKSTRTIRLGRRDLDRYAASIAAVPCLFQEYIEKDVEFRITIIGDDVFTAEIDSQHDERTRVDWRQYDVPMRLRRTSLPAEVEQRCLELMRSYGLTYSAMDVIRTPDGRHVFLENNPCGQFGFVDYLVPELGIAEALIHRLASGTPAPQPL